MIPLPFAALVMVMALLPFAGAHADTANLRKAKSQLEFRTPERSASGGSTARSEAPPADEQEARFRRLDIDGDGSVSKAEAAGHADVTLGFDRADRNRNGKLSRAEFDRLGKAAEKKARTRQAKAGKGADSASAGGTKPR